MEYKDFIKSGNKVAFIPQSYDPFFGWGFNVDPTVVTIGEYPPYFRDGTPDPTTPEEYNYACYVEIEEDVAGEKQIRLDELFAIIPEEEEKWVVYDTEVCKLIGKVDSAIDNYCVIDSTNDGDWIIVDKDDIQICRTIGDLSYDELKQLWTEILPGSIYLSDYINTLGISAEDAECACETYGEETGWGYDDDWDSEYNDPEKFAEYYTNVYFG